MKLTFLGAAHEVTGSRFLLEACGKNIMIDYGMEQGADLYENTPLPITEGSLDAVLLTHAHIDHSGYLPLLYKNGFRGHVYATEPTTDLCKIMLLDSAHIQESDAEYKNRKNQRSGKPLVEPLYTQEHALGVHSQFMPCRYNDSVDIFDGITIRMVDVGHLLGSAAIEVTVREGDTEKILVFSGDIGNIRQPLLRDPIPMHRADYVIMESTYGDRKHNRPTDYVTALAQVLQRTFDRGGNVIIPSFAVGRTQEMLYFIRQIKAEGLLKGHENFPVYVDSPLANEATNIFINNRESCYDEEALSYVHQGINPLVFDGLIRAVSSDDSKAINSDSRPKVIISASGMCEAGRIKHHLKHNLWGAQNTVLFVGYQSTNTLGRSLVEGAKTVKLFGETINVSAEILQLPGVSGHADVDGLMNWAKAVSGVKKYFINHGDAPSADSLALRIHEELGADTYAPYSGAEFDLISGEITVDAKAKPIVRKKTSGANLSPTFRDLVDAADRLSRLIKISDGRANADMRKLTEAINRLCDDWEI